MNKKQIIDELKKEQELKDEAFEETEEGLDVDKKVYVSESENPDAFYKYKMNRTTPDAFSDYRGKIDHDIIFANLGGSKPDKDKIIFVFQTIDAFENVFCIDKEELVRDKNGLVQYKLIEGVRVPMRRTRRVFDERFRVITSFLLIGNKGELTASRAMGNDREAILDAFTNIKKKIEKDKDDRAGMFGLGTSK